MKWTTRQIRESCCDGILDFKEILDLTTVLKERKSEIIRIEPVQANGYFVVRDEDIVLHCQLDTSVTLPSTRSLKEVDVPLNLMIKERYVETDLGTDVSDYEEATIVLEHDYIDLEISALDNILLNLPVKVLDRGEEEEALPSGKDWAVITEEDYYLQQKDKDLEDSRFAALKTLLKDRDD